MNLYVVYNQEGHFFRAKGKGYGRGGPSWVESLDRAKFYPKIGQAKSRVTWFSREYPQFGVPNILEFTFEVSQAKIIDMGDITKKAIQSIERRKLERQKRNAQYELDRLQADQNRIKQRIEELRR